MGTRQNPLFFYFQVSRCNFPLWGTSVKNDRLCLNIMEYLRIAFYR
nr:MAG TPA: hypothetical protein [Caudoviricetes sp.]